MNTNDNIVMKGDIAYCSQGKLGLITSETQVSVDYPDGSPDMVWMGVNLKDFTPWSSRIPKVVAHIGHKQYE